MAFRDREKKRQLGLAGQLFTTEALASNGTFEGKAYDFCLADPRSAENLWQGLRDDALGYFHERNIPWHAQIEVQENAGITRAAPSGHLCDSQSFCVNVWLPFANAPERLEAVLRGLGYPVAEALPISLDQPSQRYVAFEWIGQRNYLGEGPGGKPVADDKRKRGQNSTSADVAVRFRRPDDRVQVVLIEWKYTECYASRSIRIRKSGTDRLRTYAPHLHQKGSPFAGTLAKEDDLFFDPFDQLMRLQLLAAAMEREREMDADVVSVLHLVPRANRELLEGVTSPNLAKLAPVGSTIHDVWRSVVGPARFDARHVDVDLLPLVIREAPDPDWAAWLQRRYGGMV